MGHVAQVTWLMWNKSCRTRFFFVWHDTVWINAAATKMVPKLCQSVPSWNCVCLGALLVQMPVSCRVWSVLKLKLRLSWRACRPDACVCVAACCSVSQCVAACCSVSQCVAVCCSMLQCVAICCSVFQCLTVGVWTSRWACGPVLCILQCHVLCCRVLQMEFGMSGHACALCCGVLQSVAVCLVCCSVLQRVVLQMVNV